MIWIIFTKILKDTNPNTNPNKKNKILIVFDDMIDLILLYQKY